MKVPNFKDNNVVSIGHNSNRSISQEAYQQLKDKLQSVLGMLTEADKKHRASHGDDYYFADELTNLWTLQQEVCPCLMMTAYSNRS